MKILPLARAGICSALCLLTTVSGFSKPLEKGVFSNLGGHYSGTWSITAGNVAVATAMTSEIVVPKSGSTMTISFSGLLAVQEQVYPIQTSFRLTNKRKLTGSAALMGFAGPIATLPATFSGSGKTFSFALNSAPGANLEGTPFIGSAFYTLHITKSSFVITGQGTLIEGQGATATPIQIVISARKAKD